MQEKAGKVYAKNFQSRKKAGKSNQIRKERKRDCHTD